MKNMSLSTDRRVSGDDGETEILIGNTEDALRKEGFVLSATRGTSMRPLLRTGRDVVLVRAKEERLKENDVALYRRGDRLVLHRVVKVTEEGYKTLGDNTFVPEFVSEENAIGVMTEILRKGKTVSVTDKRYLRYVSRIRKTFRVRRFFARLRSVFVAAGRRVFLREKGRKGSL